MGRVLSFLPTNRLRWLAAYIRRAACCSFAASFLWLGLDGTPVGAENTVRWSSQGDALTMDPHAQNEGQTLTMAHQIHQPLIEHNAALQKEPALAKSWRLIEPTIWEFDLQQGVFFHDGRPFNADDVVFSFDRALAPSSDMKDIISSVASVTAIDEMTVHIHTKAPNPILPDQITNILIMSRSWAEEYGVTLPQDTASGQETYAVRHTNGTGAFILELREPDVRTILVKNRKWWGLSSGHNHNIDRIIYQPVVNSATRVAALLSGELDFVSDTPLQDLRRVETTPGLVVKKVPEVRVIFLGLNTSGPELSSSSLKGRNPFSDLRVRLAMNMAVDSEAITQRIMRGMAAPAGNIVPPGIHGYSKELDERVRFDPDGARRLLAESGYPEGFDLQLDCPNDRYVNDEAICQAVVGMLARVGVRVRLDAKPRTLHFPKLQNNQTDFYMLGWGSATMDAHYHLSFLGLPNAWNRTSYVNDRLSSLINEMAAETNLRRRNAMIAEASGIIRNAHIYIPLHHQMLAWTMKSWLDLPIQADNQPQFRLARIISE